MAEMLVALSITAIMTTVIIVQTAPGVPAARAAALGTSMQSLTQALNEFKHPQSGTAKSWPKSLEQLATHPKRLRAPGVVVLNLCDDSLGYAYKEDSLHWRGPYLLTRATSGIKVDQMIIQPTLRRDPARPPASDINAEGDLIIDVINVDQSVAEAFETAHEGQSFNLTAGDIRWSADAPGSRRGTLEYRLRIDGC